VYKYFDEPKTFAYIKCELEKPNIKAPKKTAKKQVHGEITESQDDPDKDAHIKLFEDYINMHRPFHKYEDDKKPYPKSLSYEPKKALFASEEGFGAYREILNEAKMYLKENGLLIFEIDPINAAKLLEIYPKTLIKKDINGKERIAILKQKDL